MKSSMKSPMKINVLVTGGLYDSQSGYSALQFCKATILAGHNIEQVFFYQAAVSQGSKLAEPLADEFNANESWVQLTKNNNVKLVVCISAAERRGIISEAQRIELAKESSNLHAAFTVAGLGALHEASLNSDRTVTFK